MSSRGVAANVVVGASLLVPLLPLVLIADRKAYIASAVWSVLVRAVVQRLREWWRS